MTYYDSFYARVDIPPPGQFVAIREWLLALAKPKWPKWRLRLAADLLCELHACRPNPPFAVPGFEGRGLCVEAAAYADLEKRPERPFQQVHFQLDCREGQWQWRAMKWRWHIEGDADRIAAVRTRLLTAFHIRQFDALGLDLLARPACLLCGKLLTDPLSMARLIGPECAGTAQQAGSILWNLAGDKQPDQLVFH